MLGRNSALPQENTDGLTLWVQEIFYTLQGEGPFTGNPAVFVRLGGCNLKCFWCDTDFESSDRHAGVAEILAEVESLRLSRCNLVVITGGEPFRQNIVPLVNGLLAKGLVVQIETNGTLWLDLPENPNLHIVCSPKTAHLNEQIVIRAKSFKYVIAYGGVDAEDGLPNMSTQGVGIHCAIARPPQGADVYVMPLDDLSDSEQSKLNTRACVEVALKYGYKLTLQTHKIVNIK